MFIHSFAAIVLVLPALASAISVFHNNHLNDVGTTNGVLPTTGNLGPATNQCNTGPLQCCNQLQSADSSVMSTFLGMIGVVTGGPNTLVGLSCSPISVLGAFGEGSSCSSQPVCCTNNEFNGLVAVGCQPVNIVARGLEELVNPAVIGVPFDPSNAAAPTNVENLPANPADLLAEFANLPAEFANLPAEFANLPAEFANLPADLADLPADFANLFFGLPVAAAQENPANPFPGF